MNKHCSILVVIIFVFTVLTACNTPPINLPFTTSDTPNTGESDITTDYSYTSAVESFVTDAIIETEDPITTDLHGSNIIIGESDTINLETEPIEDTEQGREAKMAEIVVNIYKTAEGKCNRSDIYASDLKNILFYEGKLIKELSFLYFGTDIDFLYGVYSEAKNVADAYLLCLIYLDEDMDIEATISSIKENVNLSRKVIVTADGVSVTSNGHYILMVMGTENDISALPEAFRQFEL